VHVSPFGDLDELRKLGASKVPLHTSPVPTEMSDEIGNGAARFQRSQYAV